MVRIDPEFALDLCTTLGGTDVCPNFSRMLECAQKIHRKRARCDETSAAVIATRGDILFKRDTALYLTSRVSGMQLLDRFLRFLATSDVKYMSRSLVQRDFHKHFTIACLPHIVGEKDWEKNRSAFLDRFELDEFKAEVIITTPRRFGKTTAVAIFTAALLCVCERMWVSIFSTGKRASKGLLTQIKEVIDSFPGMSNRIISSNVEELVIQPVGTSGAKAASRCYSYPSSVKVSLPVLRVPARARGV